jgi:hypothetical protein
MNARVDRWVGVRARFGGVGILILGMVWSSRVLG